MKRTYLRVGSVIMGMVWGGCVGSVAVTAQDEGLEPEGPAGAAPASLTEPTDYTYGTVEAVSATQLVIREYNFETGEETSTTYTIDPNVHLTNVNALTEIAVGDEVDVDYATRGDAKVVTGIIVDRSPSGGVLEPEPALEEDLDFGYGYEDEE